MSTSLKSVSEQSQRAEPSVSKTTEPIAHWTACPPEAVLSDDSAVDGRAAPWQEVWCAG